jgi:hypothetical protein
MTEQLDLFSQAKPGPQEDSKDPKTGKTISRKRAAVMAVGAVAAGAAVNEILGTPGIADITLDSDGDGIGDTVITDINEDGVYETTTIPGGESAPADSAEQQSWNPNTAPMAGSGTVNNEMSFEDAFSSAREELGAGGVFAWHGQYYNTFYAEELNDDNQPVVEYEVAEHHSLEPLDEYESAPAASQQEEFTEEPQQTGDSQEAQDPQDTQETQPAQEAETGSEPGMMAADFNADGGVDAVYVDINQDGSADAVYSDMNQDGQIADDEVVLIHDPENLERPETAVDGSTMSADSDADGVDDILLVDVEGDQVADAVGVDQNSDQQIDESEIIILNPEAMENAGAGEAPVEYQGEIAADMPEDVSEEVIDEMTDDVANLEDNFDEIDNWS